MKRYFFWQDQKLDESLCKSCQSKGDILYLNNCQSGRKLHDKQAHAM